MTIEREREIKDARGIRDVGTSGKRRKSLSSSSSGKRPKASSSRGFQGRGHQGQGQVICFHCQQPGHMRWDSPQRKGSQGFGTVQSQSSVG